MNWLMGLAVMLIALFGPALVRVPPKYMPNTWRRRREAVRKLTARPPRRRRLRRPRRGEAPRPTRRRPRIEPEGWWVMTLFGLPLAAWFYVVAGWGAALGCTALILAFTTWGPGRLWWIWAALTFLVFIAFSIFWAWWMALVGLLFVAAVLLLGHQRTRRHHQDRVDV